MHTHVFPYFLPSMMAHILTHTHLYSQHSDLELQLNDMSMSTVLFSTTYEYHIIISSSYFVDTPLNSTLNWKTGKGRNKKNENHPSTDKTQHKTQHKKQRGMKQRTVARNLTIKLRNMCKLIIMYLCNIPYFLYYPPPFNTPQPKRL